MVWLPLLTEMISTHAGLCCCGGGEAERLLWCPGWCEGHILVREPGRGGSCVRGSGSGGAGLGQQGPADMEVQDVALEGVRLSCQQQFWCHQA